MHHQTICPKGDAAVQQYMTAPHTSSPCPARQSAPRRRSSGAPARRWGLHGAGKASARQPAFGRQQASGEPCGASGACVLHGGAHAGSGMRRDRPTPPHTLPPAATATSRALTCGLHFSQSCVAQVHRSPLQKAPQIGLADAACGVDREADSRQQTWQQLGGMEDREASCPDLSRLPPQDTFGRSATALSCSFASPSLPMGFMSAEEQSYLVRYPRSPSSTLAAQHSMGKRSRAVVGPTTQYGSGR